MNTGPPRPAVRRQLGGRKKSGKLRPRLREPCMEPGSPPPPPGSASLEEREGVFGVRSRGSPSTSTGD